jgi:hypothetical protein
VRIRASLALLLVASGWLVGNAAANGDPASDVLLTDNVYLPYDAPTASTAASLGRAVERAYARHLRIKVAVIGNQLDLGDVPSLFGKPGQYAKFLGIELESVYVGPLLIVMPAGFGIYDGGRSTAAEERVLETLKVGGTDAEALTRTAAHTVDRLVNTGALRSRDITAPFVAALPATVRRGAVAQLMVRVGDDSGWARVVARIMVKSHAVATRRSALLRVMPTRPVSLHWKAIRNLPKQGVQLCALATDAAGNRSATVCSSVRVR